MFRGHLPHELMEPGFRKALGAKEPDPADLFSGKTAVARLAPDDLGMAVDSGRDLLD